MKTTEMPRAGRESSDIIEVASTSATRVCFHLPSGARVTVHFRNGELRACASGPMRASHRHEDVVALAVSLENSKGAL